MTKRCKNTKYKITYKTNKNNAVTNCIFYLAYTFDITQCASVRYVTLSIFYSLQLLNKNDHSFQYHKIPTQRISRCQMDK
jgi:hypothetical protein